MSLEIASFMQVEHATSDGVSLGTSKKKVLVNFNLNAITAELEFLGHKLTGLLKSGWRLKLEYNDNFVSSPPPPPYFVCDCTIGPQGSSGLILVENET